MAPRAVHEGNLGSRLLAVLWREFRAVIPPTVFFFFGFNLILFTKRLFLADYLVVYTGFFIATTGALIVGKTVLVADKMTFLRRLDDEPLVYPILFKSAVYTLFVFVARLIEALIHYLVQGGVIGHGGFVGQLVDDFSWARFSAIQLWIFVLFLIYVTATEFAAALGGEELYEILFTRRSSNLQRLW